MKKRMAGVLVAVILAVAGGAAVSAYASERGGSFTYASEREGSFVDADGDGVCDNRKDVNSCTGWRSNCAAAGKCRKEEQKNQNSAAYQGCRQRGNRGCGVNMR